MRPAPVARQTPQPDPGRCARCTASSTALGPRRSRQRSPASFAPTSRGSDVESATLGTTSSLPARYSAVVRERDRAPLEGAPPGEGYSLVVEFFVEQPGRARILTAGMDIRRPPRTARRLRGASRERGV